MYQSSAYKEGYEESLARAVAALSEAIADEGKIVALLQKHWDLSRIEAEERLSHERTEGFLQRDFLSMAHSVQRYDREGSGTIRNEPRNSSGDKEDRQGMDFGEREAIREDRKRKASYEASRETSKEI